MSETCDICLNFTTSRVYVLPSINLELFLFQYDYDNDGIHELVLATADGVVVFVKSDGSFLEGETFKVGQIITFNNVK